MLKNIDPYRFILLTLRSDLSELQKNTLGNNSINHLIHNIVEVPYLSYEKMIPWTKGRAEELEDYELWLIEVQTFRYLPHDFQLT